MNDLRSPAAGVDWHEAVAVGAALGTLLVEARVPKCPRPGAVTLLPSGDLRVTGAGHVDGSAAAGVAFVVAGLLDLTPCPAELRQVVDRYLADRSDDATGLHALLSELAFFERPDRREVLAAVALRAEPAIERARHTAALEALTERTRQAQSEGRNEAQGVGASPVLPAEAEPDGDPSSDGWAAGGHDGYGHLILPVVIGVLAFLGVAYGTAAWLNREPPAPARAEVMEDDATVPAPDQRTAPAAPARSRMPRPAPAPNREAPPGVAASGRPAVDAPGLPATPPRTAEPGLGQPAAAPPPAAPAPAAARSPRAVDVTIAEREGRVVPAPIAPQRPATRGAASGRVFQAGDPLVTPAVLVRPKLPDNPPAGVPEEQIGTLEFVVTETGAVEHVHLVSPANRYQERMLVAAAKSWHFQPATRDGRPVRFRTRIRVTL